MEYGVLGSFQNMMAELTPEELEQADQTAFAADTDVAGTADGGDSVEPELDDRPVSSDGVFGGPSRGPAAAPPIDERARVLAQRLAGREAQPIPIAVIGWTIHVEGRPTVHLDSSTPGPILIGRGGADDAPLNGHHLPVDLAVASREHCHIALEGAQAVVTDLGSTNGTTIYRDGHAIVVNDRDVPLRDGDIITTAGGAAVLATISTVGP